MDGLSGKDIKGYNNLELSIKELINSFDSTENMSSIEGKIYYNTAKNFGTKLQITTYDQLIEKIYELGIGQARIKMISDKKIIIQLYECFTCSSIAYLGKAICYFEGGILAGAVSTVVGRDIDAIETRCNTLGDSFCEFELTEVSESTQDSNIPNIKTSEETNLLNLSLYSLNLVKNYKKIENTSKNFYDMNQKLNKALDSVKEINEFNEVILNSIPNSLALIDNNGVIIRINNKYENLCFKHKIHAENKNIKELGWNTRYKEVLENKEAEMWQEIIDETEFLIFESPIDNGYGVLRQLIPVESDFMNILLKKMNFLEKEIRYYKNKALEQEKHKIDNMIVVSDKMKETVHYIKKVSKTDATVLLRGESGTGKSVLAEKIHRESIRREDAFVYIDCTTIPKNFFEAELFGYEPGAFTGAKKEGKVGKLEVAHGGTVFLDEIGEVPTETQSKLLRFLQERKFEKIGGVKTHSVDVRVIAATNQDLENMVKEGKFRKDLYYRLNVIDIAVPPLRDRWEDIPHLINKYILEFSKETGVETKDVSEEAMKTLINYEWPGNIRELENIVKRLVIFSEGKMITNQDVFAELKSNPNTVKLANYKSSDLDNEESRLIVELLEKYDYNKTRVSKEMKITRQSLYNKMKKYNIEY